MSDLSDADLIRLWAQAGVEVLREHRQELNALNVFPVPDGDTGTNMYLTFRAAAEAEAARTGADDDAADALTAMARGALLGARGNSGVILAQVLQAGAHYATTTTERLNLQTLLIRVAQAARAAVANPIEGTALTVLDAAAQSLAREPGAAATAARETLERTPDMLPALREAGVVDAGGRAAVLLLDTLNAIWHGEAISSPAVGFVPLSVPQLKSCDADAAYEVMFVVPVETIDAVEAAIENHGVSLVTTRGVDLAQVHIHADAPELVIACAHAVAPVRHIRMELLSAPSASRKLVAQAFGSGVIRSLVDGGVVVVPGEPDARPSVQDFVSAALKSGAAEVVLLASDADSIQVCEIAAAELSREAVTVAVVASASLTETLAAAAVFDAAAEFDDCVQSLRSAVGACSTVSLCKAFRDSKTAVGDVAEGDELGFFNGTLVEAGADIVDVLCATSLHVPDPELITVLVGAGVGADDRADVIDALADMFPAAEATVIDGHQDVWQFVIGFE